MADGGALAISRNVTALLNQSPPTDPALAPLPPMQAPTADVPVAQSPEAFAPPAGPIMDMLPHYAPETQAPVESQKAANLTPDVEAAIDVAAETDFMADAQNISASNVEVSAELAPPPAEPVVADPVVAEPVVAEPVVAAPVVDVPVPAAPAAVETRDHERRALPIENDENVLGSNWRDAVIAKAVGSEIADTMQTGAPSAPVAPEEPSPIEAPASQLTASPNDTDNAIRILLAEDNAINALLTRTLLEADGCYVDVVEDGSLAVDAMRVNKYDMILMDMRMPNMDGLESTRKIRSLSNDAKAIPIVALTANAFDDDRNACFDAGMNDFMTKPVSAEELQQMVQTWTKKSEVAAA